MKLLNLKRNYDINLEYFILIFWVIVSLCSFTSCTHVSKTEFIYIEDGHFKYKDSIFFPLMVNYVVELRNINHEMVLSPYRDYDDPNRFESDVKTAIHRQMNAHFQLIEEMGFNTVRICFDRAFSNVSPKGFCVVENQYYDIAQNTESILKELDTLLNLAAKHHL